MEHYACTIDLLGSYGLLKEAENVIRNMVVGPNVAVWRALVG